VDVYSITTVERLHQNLKNPLSTDGRRYLLVCSRLQLASTPLFYFVTLIFYFAALFIGQHILYPEAVKESLKIFEHIVAIVLGASI